MKDRITVKQLGTVLENDEYYNGAPFFPYTVNENQRIMKEVMQSLKYGGQEETGFTEWYQNLPNSNPHSIAFAATLCTGIDKHLPDTEEKISWRHSEFSETFRDDLEVDIGDLKLHFRKFNYPLPAEIFPECNDNTKVRLQLHAVSFDPKYSMYPIVNDLGQKITDLLMEAKKTEKEEKHKQKMIDTLFEKWDEAKEIADFEDVTPTLELKLQWTRGNEYYWKDEKAELWPLLYAILFVSHCEKEDSNSFYWWRRSLLYKTSQKTDWEERTGVIKNKTGTFVDPLKWLIWCKQEGFNAPDILWRSVSRQSTYRKLMAFCNQNQGLSPDDIGRILEIDETLDQCKLLDECYKKIGSLNEIDRNSGTESTIATAITRKGELLLEISERGSIPCVSQIDVNSKNTEIGQARSEIEEINKALDGKFESQLDIQSYKTKAIQPITQTKTGLSIFKSMSCLTAEEVSVCFTAKNWLEITARGKKTHVHCDKLGLMMARKPSGDELGLNQQGRILLDMAHKKYPEGDAASKAVNRLKSLLAKHLNIKGKIFKPKQERWEPLLHALIDKTKRPDERAKDRAIITSHNNLTDKNNYDNSNYEQSPEDHLIDAELAAEYGDIHRWKDDT